MGEFTPTTKTKVRRRLDRASYDREFIYSILDEAFVCQVGFVADGQPYVVPTNYVRVGDKLFLHGSPAGRMMKTLSSDAPDATYNSAKRAGRRKASGIRTAPSSRRLKRSSQR